VQRGVCVVPKTARISRLAENINVFDFELTPDEMNAIGARSRRDPERSPGGGRRYGGAIPHIPTSTYLPDIPATTGALDRNRRFNDPGVFCEGMGLFCPIYD